MSMNHIKLLLSSYCCRHQSITGHFFHQVGSILPGKLILIFKTNPFFIPSSTNTFIHFIRKPFRVHIRHQVGTNLHEINILPILFYLVIFEQGFHITGINNLCSTLVFIPTGLRHHEQYFNSLFG